jgi:hypothetical protein
MIRVLLLVLLSSGAAAADIELIGNVELTGSVTMSERGNAILSLRLDNRTESPICLKDWYRNRISVIEKTYSDYFIVKDENGAHAKSQSSMVTVMAGSENRRVYLVRQGESAEALINLSSLYRLDSGSWSVSLLISTVRCDVYAEREVDLKHPGLLKYMYLNRSKDFFADFVQGQDILVLEPVRFEIPDSSVARQHER